MSAYIIIPVEVCLKYCHLEKLALVIYYVLFFFSTALIRETHQEWANYGLRVKLGPPSHFYWSAKPFYWSAKPFLLAFELTIRLFLQKTSLNTGTFINIYRRASVGECIWPEA